MKEIRSWNVEDLAEKYSMMRGNSISMQVQKDWDPIEIEGWLLYEDMDADSCECKTLLAITNLPPRPMMGIESCGMLLSAIHYENGEEKLNLVMLDDVIPAGAKLY